jgi:hypothetical protein
MLAADDTFLKEHNVRVYKNGCSPRAAYKHNNPRLGDEPIPMEPDETATLTVVAMFGGRTVGYQDPITPESMAVMDIVSSGDKKHYEYLVAEPFFFNENGSLKYFDLSKLKCNP